VDVATERDRRGAVVIGHAIAGMQLHAGEVRAELGAEVLRL
jgi:hypothetical protein